MCVPLPLDPRAVGDPPFRQDSSGRACVPTQTLRIPQMSQVEPVRREGELWRIRTQAGLSVVAIMAVDIFFHFFYILTIPSDLKFANRLPDSALGGCTSGPEQGLGKTERQTLCTPWPHCWELTPCKGTAPRVLPGPRVGEPDLLLEIPGSWSYLCSVRPESYGQSPPHKGLGLISTALVGSPWAGQGPAPPPGTGGVGLRGAVGQLPAPPLRPAERGPG